MEKMPGDVWQKFANLRLLYAHQWLNPGKKLLFMGCELAQWTEWNHDVELDWALEGQPYHDGVRRFLGDLNQLYKTRPALHATDCDPEGLRVGQRGRRRPQRAGVRPPHRRTTPGICCARSTSPRSRARTTDSACPPPGTIKRC